MTGVWQSRHRSASCDDDAPMTFIEGSDQRVESRFVIRNEVIGLEVGGYNKRDELVIDPLTRVWATYVGGNSFDLALSVQTGPEQQHLRTGHDHKHHIPCLNWRLSGNQRRTGRSFCRKILPGWDQDLGNVLRWIGAGICHWWLTESRRVARRCIDRLDLGNFEHRLSDIDWSISDCLWRRHFRRRRGCSRLDGATSLGNVSRRWASASNYVELPVLSFGASGNLCVVGMYIITDFPVTSGAYQGRLRRILVALLRVFPSGGTSLGNVCRPNVELQRPAATGVRSDSSGGYVITGRSDAGFPTTSGHGDQRLPADPQFSSAWIPPDSLPGQPTSMVTHNPGQFSLTTEATSSSRDTR